MRSNVHHPHDQPKTVSGILDAQNTHGYTGNKPPRAKNAHLNHVPIHSGMVSRTKQNGFTFGGDASSRNDADPASPLAGPPAGKRLQPVVAAFGQRSRTSEHNLETGKVLLDSATKDPHHPGFSHNRK